ncbi:hypothetical protein KIN20_000085 [Parelaphostrongylus tenuis]|uniref:Uncharacterized protein n=1 Tax=Parelaphostrongylus tenuis TaxID=148309 RepID=A0AAD5MCR2_PARTN|nr:hypothetical protein KIN20_000085 [Parelaphostrongylus tenuis]
MREVTGRRAKHGSALRSGHSHKDSPNFTIHDEFNIRLVLEIKTAPAYKGESPTNARLLSLSQIRD